jgi:hypothetical protein
LPQFPCYRDQISLFTDLGESRLRCHISCISNELVARYCDVRIGSQRQFPAHFPDTREMARREQFGQDWIHRHALNLNRLWALLHNLLQKKRISGPWSVLTHGGRAMEVRVSLSDGTYPFLDPIEFANGKLKPSMPSSKASPNTIPKEPTSSAMRRMVSACGSESAMTLSSHSIAQ